MKRLVLKHLLLLVLLAFTGCGGKSTPPKVDLTYIGDDYPVQESWDAKIVFSDSGRVKAILLTPYLAQYSRQGALERQMDSTFRVDFFDEFGKHTSFITANRAKVHPNTDMEAFENVLVVSDDCTRVTTEYMKWTVSDKKIRSDKFVTITKPTETLSGFGFESDQSLKNYRIFKASGQMKVKDNATF